MRLLVIILFLLVPFYAYAGQVEEYVSHDGKLRVLIIPVGKKGYEKTETRMEVHDSTGRVLLNEDYHSEDGEHGYGVVQASWTPDSQFFVYSLVNSGGHQPWNTPVMFYSRKDNKVRNVNDYIGAVVTEPEFKIKSPDFIIVSTTKVDSDISDLMERKVSLRKLIKQRGK